MILTSKYTNTSTSTKKIMKKAIKILYKYLFICLQWYIYLYMYTCVYVCVKVFMSLEKVSTLVYYGKQGVENTRYPLIYRSNLLFDCYICMKHYFLLGCFFSFWIVLSKQTNKIYDYNLFK